MGAPPLARDGVDGGAQDQPTGGNHCHLIGRLNDAGVDNSAAFLLQIHGNHPLAVPVLHLKLADGGALAKAQMGDDEQIVVIDQRNFVAIAVAIFVWLIQQFFVAARPFARMDDITARQLVFAHEADGVHASGRASHRPYIRLAKANRLAFLADQNDILVARGLLHPRQLIPLVEGDGNNACGAHVLERFDLHALDTATPRHHDQKFRLAKLAHGERGRDPLILPQQQHIHQRVALARAVRLGNLIRLGRVNLALVGEEQNRV